MKKSTVVSRWLPIVALVAVAAPTTALAETISGVVCPTGDSAHDFLTYRNLDGGCHVNDSNGNFIPLQLLNFSLFVNGALTQDSSFESTILVNPTLINGNLNLGISGFPSVNASTTTSYELDYTIDPPPILDGMAADFDPPFGNINGSLTYCGDPTATGGCLLSGTFAFGIRNGVPFAGSSGPFVNANGAPNPISTLEIRTFFTLNPGGGTATGFDDLIYSVVTTEPEPGAWLLAASGLGLIAFRRKQRRG
jgi:MYXO-CTERM domain-containing protein